VISIRPMTVADVPLGMRLKRQANWNQTEQDWHRFLQLEPDGCFVAEYDGEPAGTITTCVLGPVAWIAMVLVDERLRRRGIGTALLRHALGHLDELGVPTVRLDATPFGKPLYEKLGFEAEYEVARYGGVPSLDSTHRNVRPYTGAHLDAIVALDRRVTGADRRKLLCHMLQERPQDAHVAVERREVAGYVAARPGERALQIGPCVARTASAGRHLLAAALGRSAARPVCVDIPAANRAAGALARAAGLSVQRGFVRMFRGVPVRDCPRNIWACFGPEMG